MEMTQENFNKLFNYVNDLAESLGKATDTLNDVQATIQELTQYDTQEHAKVWDAMESAEAEIHRLREKVLGNGTATIFPTNPTEKEDIPVAPPEADPLKPLPNDDAGTWYRRFFNLDLGTKIPVIAMTGIYGEMELREKNPGSGNKIRYLAWTCPGHIGGSGVECFGKPADMRRMAGVYPEIFSFFEKAFEDRWHKAQWTLHFSRIPISGTSSSMTGLKTEIFGCGEVKINGRPDTAPSAEEIKGW